MRPRKLSRMVAALAATVAATVTLTAAAAASDRPGSATSEPAASACSLGNGIQHVIYLQFDNVHFTRDTADVPSDLEQMPNLLDFLTGAGTLITHEHTPLIAHTADDIVTSESGLYPSNQGLAVSNTYNYYTPSGTTDTAGDFAYWTDPIVDYDSATGAPVGDSTPNLVSRSGTGVPAPWAPYAKAGCNFGSVAAANTELENTTPDVPLVYGPNSPQAKEAENPNLQNKASADFEGLSVHCAQASAVCAKGGVPDVLPSEPGGYSGYQALFGNKAIQPVISPTGAVRNLDGKVIKDFSGDVGFPGYDGMTGTNALAYTLDMQLSGVPVTYTYLTDLHDSQTTGGGMGPGETQYETQLKAEDKAFGTFFADLQAHGITKQNTLFVVTADEGDHFAGGTGSPAGCDGVHTPCTYSNVGEVDADLNGLLATEQKVTTPFQVSSDSAPVLYLPGQPARTDAQVRALERADAKLTADDLASGRTVPLTQYLADPVELNLLHMQTGDPKRTPTFVSFDNPDFWVQGGSTTCTNNCVSQEAGGDAWNHGDFNPQINTTFLGLVGPGVQNMGVDDATWSSHADIEPTLMSVLGLQNDYTPDGRVLTEVLDGSTPPQIAALGELYTQLDSPVGAFAASTLKASTEALASDTPGDAFYTSVENKLTQLGAERDAAVKRIQQILDAYGSGAHAAALPAPSVLNQASTSATGLLGQAAQLAKARP